MQACFSFTTIAPGRNFISSYSAHTHRDPRDSSGREKGQRKKKEEATKSRSPLQSQA
jgi:hypothetical protein